MQEAPAASEVPQLLVSPNGPVTPIDDIDTALLFGFDTVTDCAGLVEPTTVLGNDSLDGDAVSAVAPLAPVPDSATVSGLRVRWRPPTGCRWPLRWRSARTSR